MQNKDRAYIGFCKKKNNKKNVLFTKKMGLEDLLWQNSF